MKIYEAEIIKEKNNEIIYSLSWSGNINCFLSKKEALAQAKVESENFNNKNDGYTNVLVNEITIDEKKWVESGAEIINNYLDWNLYDLDLSENECIEDFKIETEEHKNGNTY